MRNIFMYLVIALSFTGELFAGEYSKDIQELLIKSGMEKQLQSLPSVMQSQMQSAIQSEPSLKKLPPEEEKQLIALFVEVFGSADFANDVKNHIAKNMSKADTKSALKWLKSSLGKKITRLEEDSSTAAGYQEMMKYAQTLGSAPPPKAYIDQVGQLSNSIKAVESSVNMAMNMQLAMGMAVAMNMPNFTPDLLKTIQKQLEATRPNVTNAITQQVIVSLLFTYRDLPQKELQQYIDFAASKSGVKYHSVITEALNSAMIKASKKIGEEIVRMLESQKSKSNT